MDFGAVAGRVLGDTDNEGRGKDPSKADIPQIGKGFEKSPFGLFEIDGEEVGVGSKAADRKNLLFTVAEVPLNFGLL